VFCGGGGGEKGVCLTCLSDWGWRLLMGDFVTRALLRGLGPKVKTESISK